MSNYPSGVTGNEPQIAGWNPHCAYCGHDYDEHWVEGECAVTDCLCVGYTEDEEYGPEEGSDDE